MKIKLILPLLLILLFVTSVNAIVDPFLTIDGETEISFGETITFNAGFISSHEPVHMAIKLLDSSKSLINLIKDEDIYWLPDTTSYVEKFTLTRDDYKKGGQYYINYIVEMFNPDLGKTETDTEEISFEVSKVAPKLIKDIEDIEFDEDNTYTLDLDEYFDDDEEEQLTYTASSVSDIDVDIQGSIVTLTPNLNWNGDRTVTFYAFDGTYSTPSNLVNIKVNPVNDAPVIDSYSPLTAVNMKVNEQQTFTVNASDVDNPTLHYDWYVNEEKQTETSNSFTYTGSGNLGNRFVRVEVYDNDGLSALNLPSWTFDIYEDVVTNNPPYTPHSPNPADKATNVEITKTLSWQGGDPDTGDTVSYDVYFGTNSNPEFKTTTNSLSYNPSLSYSTTYYWKIIAKDNHNAAKEGLVWEFTTKAEPVITNNPPQSYIDSPSSDITKYVGSTITFSGHGKDPEGNDITKYNWQITGPRTLTSSKKSFSYKFNTLGTYKVYFKTKDHELWDKTPAVRTIKIISRPPPPPPPPPVNHAPVLANIQNKYVYENQELNFRVTASDQDNNPLTYSASNLPQGAVFGNQIFNWIPTYEQSGEYYVTFAVSDGKLSDSQRVKITVYNQNRKPEIISAPIKTLKMDKDFTKEYQYKVKAIDSDSDSLIYSLIVKPFNMLIDSISGLIKWKPIKEQIGLNEITVQASDNEDTDSQSFKVNVIYNEPVTLAKNKIHINSLYIINDEVKPGQEMLTNVAFTNEDYYKTKGRITVSIPELGIQRKSNFALDSKEKTGKIMSLEIPEDTLKGEYFVKVAISDNEVSRTKYRFVNII